MASLTERASVKADDTHEGEAPYDAAKEAESLAAKLALAYGAVSAVLGFIGAKDGTLNAILRDEPRAALLYFTLIGLAIGIGLGFKLIRPGAQVKVGKTLTPLYIVGLLILWTQLLHEGGKAAPRSISTAVGVGVGLLLLVTYSKVAPLRLVLLAAGVVLFGLGLFGLFKLAVDNKSATSRPRITATLTPDDNGLVLEGTVTARGLRSNENVLVRVEGVLRSDELRGVHVVATDDTSDAIDGTCANRCEVLFGQWVGPNADGDVDIPVKLRVAAGRFVRINVLGRSSRDASKTEKVCRFDTKTYGCLSLFPPPRAARPRLAVTWTVGDKRTMLDVEATADDVASHEALFIKVAQLGSQSTIGQTSFSPNGKGVASGKLPTWISPGGRAVCVRAIVAPADTPSPTFPPPDCSLRGGNSNSILISPPSA